MARNADIDCEKENKEKKIEEQIYFDAVVLILTPYMFLRSTTKPRGQVIKREEEI